MITGGNRLVSADTGSPRPIGVTTDTSHGLGSPRVRPSGWWFDLLMVAIFVAITIALLNRQLLDLDKATLAWSDNHRDALTWWTGYALSCLGQGGPLTYGTLAISLVLGWRRRSIRPVLVPVAAFLLTYLGIGPFKVLTNRAVPHHGPAEMFGLDHGPFSMAYPSGHTANAVVWYSALMLLIGPYLPRWFYWAVRIGAPTTVAVTMVYIDYHWLTDVLAAIPLGVVLSRMLYRIPFETMSLPRWGRRVADPRLERPVEASRLPQPVGLVGLPQRVAHASHDDGGALGRIWSTERRPAHERTETTVHRRPTPMGPGSRGRSSRARGGANTRSIELD